MKIFNWKFIRFRTGDYAQNSCALFWYDRWLIINIIFVLDFDEGGIGKDNEKSIFLKKILKFRFFFRIFRILGLELWKFLIENLIDFVQVIIIDW